ncbi:MAG: hypothetical protein ACK5Q5_06315 [Planctomycetaceae bacterium]
MLIRFAARGFNVRIISLAAAGRINGLGNGEIKLDASAGDVTSPDLDPEAVDSSTTELAEMP